ncbi:Lrp/AsnC family transcriptional regulator [Jannaschia seohaensis]|uniref:DNA-binding Lrp family transcriptional regulator n=1 Tax=Jannaschia seohaensis TaxID=475081 RepID=A0A2Y9A1S0_9RHOB|nr:Lrp/AsnC family transcriptional regulator [Jannaschia seohaensis]PWJ21937.1 DNA-binding Lrp family transcriptional regulator [Jannaschia seohaensis]SSA38215.1 DNA-binding transcriptional regulator, Lrp family [Jannaschia seohaensis]
MDDLDERLLAALVADGRASVSALAAELGVTRATVRTRMARLVEEGEIQGFRAVLRGDLGERPVRGVVLIEVEGTGARRITHTLLTMRDVVAVHSTHGRWDLVAELGADTLEALDATLDRIRRIDGVSRSETSLYLSTRRG